MLHRIAPIPAVLLLAITLNQATAQLQVVQAQAAPTQTEIRKKLIDATKELTESLKALSSADFDRRMRELDAIDRQLDSEIRKR